MADAVRFNINPVDRFGGINSSIKRPTVCILTVLGA